MRILLVEDNRDILANMADYLELKGYSVDCAQDGLSGLHLAATEHFDLIVLDIMLPGLDGYALCRRLREEARRDTPVIMLTARDALDDRLQGFKSGADDYLLKPFALSELSARIEAVLRRSQGGGKRSLQVGDLSYDLDTLAVSRAGKPLKLNPIGLKLLAVLMQKSPHLVRREALEEALWGDDCPDSDSLRSHIHQLRQVIDKPFGSPCCTPCTAWAIAWRSRPMEFRQSLARRIVIAFTLMTALVGDLLAGHHRSGAPDRGTTDLPRPEQRAGAHPLREPRQGPGAEPGQRYPFLLRRGHRPYALPVEYAKLAPGFHELFEGQLSFHALVRDIDGHRYVLLQDQSDFEDREQALYGVVLVGFILSVLLSALLGWLLARKVIAPVVRLAGQVRHRDQLLGLAPPLAPDYTSDEVGQLAQAFDDTLGRLRDALTRERLFTSDVSHELRTPLMVIATSCELLMENDHLDERSRQQVLRIGRASEEMRDLVQTFLMLARAQRNGARWCRNPGSAAWRMSWPASGATPSRPRGCASTTTPASPRRFSTTRPCCARYWATCCAMPCTTPSRATSSCVWTSADSASRTAGTVSRKSSARRCSCPSCGASSSAEMASGSACRWSSASAKARAGWFACCHPAPAAVTSASTSMALPDRFFTSA